VYNAFQRGGRRAPPEREKEIWMPPFAFFQGNFVPLAEAKVGVMTHAFNYGTGCFEGIRGNWNADEQQLYLFRMHDHYLRLHRSCQILGIGLRYSVDRMCDLTLDLVRRNDHREDVYIRPLAYKSSELVGVRMHNLEDDFLIFTTPFGNYLDVEAGINCMTSSWRRVDDNAIPARAKVTGIYVNSALAKTEAQLNGFDEAVMLTHEGHVSEGSGENIFIVSRGRLITPPDSDNILVGLTRDTIMTLAREELGLETIERSIDRSEIYAAEECFMTGTAAHVSPVLSLDRRPIGDGKIGPISARLQKLYFDIVRGKDKRYSHWVTPIFPEAERATAQAEPAVKRAAR
jgi:branched-chain amino acid aminotransferase